MSLPSLLSLGESHGVSVSLVVMLVKVTLILIAALGITLAMQRASAGARHLVWLVTLGALMLIPALCTALRAQCQRQRCDAGREPASR